MIVKTLCAVALALTLVAPCGGCRQTGNQVAAAGTKPAPPYDVRPLLRLLRPAEQRRLPRQLGLASLAELPYYDMDLALDLAGGRLAGSYTLYYRNRTGQPLPALPLLLHPNAPRELGVTEAAELKVTGVQTLDGPQVTITHRRPTLVELNFAQPLEAGAWIKLKVTFEGTLRQLPPDSNDIFSQALSSLGVASGGSGASDYGLLAVGDGIATVASAYPMVAPYANGRFDVDRPGRFGDLAYNELANFRLRTVVPAGYVVATNLVELPGSKTLRSGQPVFTSVGAATRDLALVAGQNLQRTRIKQGEVTLSSVHMASDAKAGAALLKVAAGALADYQARFGPYPYTELDVAEATLVGGAGGVEFPGMVLIAGMFYRKPSRSTNPLAMLTRLVGGLGDLLGGALDGSGGRRRPAGQMDRMVLQMGSFVVAHEVAHQYFAGLVGTDCRRQAAVDEPMAQFAAGEYMRSLYGEKEGARLTDLNVKANYGIYRMLGGQDMPAAQPVSNFPTALAYAAIVYGKAPYYYHALRRRLGKKRFDRALRHAVQRNRFKLVTLDEWIGALKQGAGGAPDVEQLARRYFHEAHGDEDLGVDESGDAVLSLMLGPEAMSQLRQGLGMLGMKPADLFRMMMGKIGGHTGPVSPEKTLDPKDTLKQLQQLHKQLKLQ